MAINQTGGINPNPYLYEQSDNRAEVTTIASHIQAIAQSKNEIERINSKRVGLGLSELKLKYTESTTAGIEIAKLNPSVMAIGTKDSINNKGLLHYNNGETMSLPNNITKFDIIRPGSFDPAKIINQYESGILQLQDLENIDTIMLQITLPNVVASELSILQIISGKYKLGIVAKNWLHNGIPTESASEVLELKGLSNPNQIIEMIKDLKNWEYIKEGKIKILGIYKSANIYIPNDRNAID